MPFYRIGSPILEKWVVGHPHDRRYTPIEAATDREAWLIGQGLADQSWRTGRKDGFILALERRELFPSPKLLSGPDVTAHSILDKHLGGYPVWVRVAVGYQGALWPEEESQEGTL